MGRDRTALHVLQEAEEAGFELAVSYGRLVILTGPRIPTLRSEIVAYSTEIKGLLIKRLRAERWKTRPRDHKWILRLGDSPRAEDGAPPYMACGSADWCLRLVRQANAIGKSIFERGRWVVLETKEIGGLASDPNGNPLATMLRLPKDVELGGPAASLTEIVDACPDCLRKLAKKSE